MATPGSRSRLRHTGARGVDNKLSLVSSNSRLQTNTVESELQDDDGAPSEVSYDSDGAFTYDDGVERSSNYANASVEQVYGTFHKLHGIE